MLLLMIALTARAVAAQTPVPGYPDLRYIIHYRDVSPEFLEFLQQSRTNFLHWHGPFYGYTGLPEREKLPATMQQARAVVDAVHQRGAKIIFYIGPCFSYGDAERQTILFDFWHRRWDTYADYLGPRPADLIECTQRDANGTPRPYEYEGQKGYHLCVNSPGVRQYTKGLIRLICEAGADGNFYDGPYVAQGSCYCKWCQRRFRKWLAESYSPAVLRDVFGVSDPANVEPPKQAGEPLWLLWRKFAAWTLYDFMRDTKEFARSLNPQYVMTSNYCMWMGEPYGPLRGSAEDIALWSKVVDVVFDEAQYGAGPRTENGQKRSNSIDYRYLVAASNGKPVALLKTAPEGKTPEAAANLTRLAIAEAAAHGATWQFHYLQGAAAEAAIEYNAFLAEHANEMRGVRSYANVGLVASVQQAYIDAPSYPCAISRELSDQHIDHRMLTDEDLQEGRFDELETLILPEVRMLSEQQLQAVKTFVREGGGLVLLGSNGDLNEWGRKRTPSLTDQMLRSVQQRGEPTGQAIYGRGRVAFLPHVDLPSWANIGLTPQQRAGLGNLGDLVEWAAGDLSLRVWGPSSVEATAMCGPGNPRRTIFVHLVNYNVDLAGSVTSSPEIGLRIRLPDGMKPGGVKIQSPDPGLECTPEWEWARPGGHTYVMVRIPRVRIYSRVKLWLLPATGAQVQGTVRLRAPASAPAGTMLRATAEYSSEQLARLGFIYSTFEGRPLAGGHCRTEGCQVTMDESRVPHSSFDRLITLGAHVRGNPLSDYWFVRITPPLTLLLKAPARIGSGVGPVALSATVCNQTDHPCRAELTFDAPIGWRVEEQRQPLELRARESQIVRCIVEPEAAAPPGRYLLKASIRDTTQPDGQSEELTITTTTEIVEGAYIARCPRTAEPPTIDGKVDDPCWIHAGVLGSFTDIHTRQHYRWPTVVRLMYDESNLYAAFECSESDPSSIVAQISHDGGEVWRDDSVELFFDPDGDQERYEQFVSNALGARNRVSPGWQVKTARDQSGWTAEISIPLAALGGARPGDVWLFNACRTRPARPQAPPEYGSWAPTEGSFHQPAKWGVLVFGE